MNGDSINIQLMWRKLLSYINDFQIQEINWNNEACLLTHQIDCSTAFENKTLPVRTEYTKYRIGDMKMNGPVTDPFINGESQKSRDFSAFSFSQFNLVHKFINISAHLSSSQSRTQGGIYLKE